MSNASNLLLVFSCLVIKVENSTDYFLRCRRLLEGESVTVIRPRKSHYSRLFCALVQHVSLPYLAFSSYPALQLRHFLWALSTCSLYCAGIFYIWQEVGLSQSVCGSLFLIVWEINSIFSKVIFPPCLSLFLTCTIDNIRKHDSAWEDYETFLTRASKCHVVPCMFLTRCIVRECKLSSFWSTGEIKKSKVNRYLRPTFNCSDM